jgi:hypothetical protein
MDGKKMTGAEKWSFPDFSALACFCRDSLLNSAFNLFNAASFGQSLDCILAYIFMKTTIILNYFCNRWLKMAKLPVSACAAKI